MYEPAAWWLHHVQLLMTCKSLVPESTFKNRLPHEGDGEDKRSDLGKNFWHFALSSTVVLSQFSYIVVPISAFR